MGSAIFIDGKRHIPEVAVGDERVIAWDQAYGASKPTIGALKNGDVVKIIGFRERCYGLTWDSNFSLHAPGIYTNPEDMIIVDSKGVERELNVDDTVAIDPSSEKYRRPGRDFVRELPDLPYYVNDIVAMPDGSNGHVEAIIYGLIGQTTESGEQLGIYQIALEDGSSLAYQERYLTLISRGRVHDYYNGVPIEFSDVFDEAAFIDFIGGASEVRNPVSNLFRWTEEEAIEALNAGLVDGFSQRAAAMSGAVSPVKYKDEELGSRLREATLSGPVPALLHISR